jgi:hypothetical protein
VLNFRSTVDSCLTDQEIYFKDPENSAYSQHSVIRNYPETVQSSSQPVSLRLVLTYPSTCSDEEKRQPVCSLGSAILN